MNPGWRVIDCTGLHGVICYQRGQIVVHNREIEQETILPLKQLAVILIGNKTSISGAAMMKLSEYDVAVITCDWRSIPVHASYPWKHHSRVGARNRAQSALSLPRQKQAWQQLIKSKVRGQAHTAKSLGHKEHSRLISLASQVRSGDTTNIESQAARFYWNLISGPTKFSRTPGMGNPGWNSILDYGYTLLRGHGIRAVSSAGLNGALGVFHRERSNAFALVDDLIEPFRPLIDWYVFSSFDSEQSLDKTVKLQLVDLIESPFDDSGKTTSTLFMSLAQDFGRYAEGDLQVLKVPTFKGRVHAS